jgi:hypothetical protein
MSTGEGEAMSVRMVDTEPFEELATDANTGQILASVRTSKDADDGSQVGPLLDRV